VAFTLAHSITLAASALGAVSLRPPPVEATIALSIVSVAMEALQRDGYLTPSNASARTVFQRGMGGTEFVLRNTHAGTRSGAFNADKWIAPQPGPGDLLLFPSYLLHEVPRNLGRDRTTLAFNAIPHRLDAWGYTLSLQP
jgi:hypothetical protein